MALSYKKRGRLALFRREKIMLKIKPIEKKEDQRAICASCSVTYNADYFAYSAYEDDKLLGICQFGMRDGKGHVYNIAPADGTDDFDALFLLGRAALNFIDLCGVHEAYYEGEESSLTLAVGFKKNAEGKFYVNLEGFFVDPCQHK